MEYEAVEETAKRWGVSTRWVQVLCHQRRILGAQRFGRIWLIPIGAEKPPDQRIKLNWGKNNTRTKR